jgi:cAMP-specific phosphodiesterase 4
VVEQLFHACDIGNPCLDFKSYISWGALVSFEFDEVARKEEELGLEVTSYLKYDNMKKFYGGQLGFCKGLVLPLWRELNVTLPGIA